MKLTREELTPELLRALLEYDPQTGEMRWLPRAADSAAFNGKCAGKIAFTSKNVNGYYHGTVMTVPVLAHRVAWAIHYGEWPTAMLDHINGVITDNRIANLRVVDSIGNGRNSAKPANNKSGVAGVIWNKRDRRWQAQIRADGKQRHVGNFEKLEDAIAARKAAEQQHGYHPNHGREPRASAA